MSRTGKTIALWTVLTFLTVFRIHSQEVENSDPLLTAPDSIHTSGFSFNHSFKTLESRYSEETEILRYSIASAGINYGSFTGGRLGYVSDLNLCIPFLIDYESDQAAGFGGFSLAYLGGIGWNLWKGRAGIQPFAGFHVNYTILSEDPIDNNLSNHILSFGLGAGSRVFYSLKEKQHIYLAITMNFDTIEFSGASYDSREIKLLSNLSYLISMGYSWSS